MSSTYADCHPYAIFFAVLTGTLPTDWSNLQSFSWEQGNIDQAPPLPHYGRDVFAIALMTHTDGRVGRVCYDLEDQVYFDCGTFHWSGPLEANAHSLSTWARDFEAAVEGHKQDQAEEATWAKLREQLATAEPNLTLN